MVRYSGQETGPRRLVFLAPHNVLPSRRRAGALASWVAGLRTIIPAVHTTSGASNAIIAFLRQGERAPLSSTSCAEYYLASPLEEPFL